MRLLGTTRLPGTTLFWLQEAQYDQNTHKINELLRNHIVFIQNFFIFALEGNNFPIMTFCDEIFDITFVATVAKIFANKIVYSFSVKRIPNLRKVVSGIFSELRK